MINDGEAHRIAESSSLDRTVGTPSDGKPVATPISQTLNTSVGNMSPSLNLNTTTAKSVVPSGILKEPNNSNTQTSSFLMVGMVIGLSIFCMLVLMWFLIRYCRKVRKRNRELSISTKRSSCAFTEQMSSYNEHYLLNSVDLS